MSRIAICSNSVIPEIGLPVGAQGFRAQGLYLGLRANGIEADIVCQHRTLRGSLNLWHGHRPKLPPMFRCISEDNIVDRINQDYDSVIFMNWAALDGFSKGQELFLVYDFFSPSMVEHSFISTDIELAKKRDQKHNLLRQADAFIGNGLGRAAYGQEYLAEFMPDRAGDHVMSVPLGVPWYGRPLPVDTPLSVFIGGFDQAWTAGPSPDQLSEIAERLGIQFHIIGHGVTQHGSRSTARSTSHLPGIHIHPVCNFSRYQEILRQCHVVLDVFDRNEERELSYSTRSAIALANGRPVVTMGFTELGSMIKNTEAGMVLQEYDLEALTDVLARLASTPSLVYQLSSGTRTLWEQQIDPAVQITPLLDTLP